MELSRFYLPTLIALFALTPVAIADNALKLGETSTAGDCIEVPNNPIQDLNFKSKNEVLALRQQLLAPYSELVASPYEPSKSIFSRIEDGKPWWGIAGQFIYGQGKRSIEGASEESRFLLNPLLLVGANASTCEIWEVDKINAVDLASPSFPYFWPVQSIKFWPKLSLGEVVYSVSSYNQELKTFKDKLKQPVRIRQFDLVAYNARDMGFNYICLDKEASINIKCSKDFVAPVEITQMIHCGGSCGYPGGCNNMSPHIAELHALKFTQLPARARLQLWRSKPKSADEKPDMIFLVDLK